MNLFFDNKIIFINLDKKYDLIYSNETYSMIKVTKEISKIISEIINYKSGSDVGNSYDNKILEILNKQKIIFYTEEEFEKNRFIYKYKKMKDKVKISLAYIHLTQKCNLKCIYCYNRDNINKKNELTTYQWYNILDKLMKIGISNFIFTGGEILLRKDLINILKYVKSKNNKFYIQVLTNGTLLNQYNNSFYECIDSLIVSLDTLNKDENAKYRLNSENYDIIGNLENIPHEYKNKIIVRSVITKENMQDIKELKAYVKNELQYEHITSLCLPNNVNEIDNIPQLNNDFNEDTDIKMNNKVINCGGCSKEIAVDSNGDIYPCQNLINKEFLVTNILYQNWYDELLNSDITKEFMNLNVNSIEFCKDCNYRYLCGGGCRAIAYKVYGKLNCHLNFLCNQLKDDAIYRLRNQKFINYNK